MPMVFLCCGFGMPLGRADFHCTCGLHVPVSGKGTPCFRCPARLLTGTLRPCSDCASFPAHRPPLFSPGLRRRLTGGASWHLSKSTFLWLSGHGTFARDDVNDFHSRLSVWCVCRCLSGCPAYTLLLFRAAAAAELCAFCRQRSLFSCRCSQYLRCSATASFLGFVAVLPLVRCGRTACTRGMSEPSLLSSAAVATCRSVAARLGPVARTRGADRRWPAAPDSVGALALFSDYV